MTPMDSALAKVQRLGLDTPPVIYFIEAHPLYDARVTYLFQRIAEGTLTGLTSVVTLAEVLVKPIQLGNTRLAQRYRELLLNSANFGSRAIDASIAERAAELRARHRLRTPDALQIAAALDAGCQAFLTNDESLKRVTELTVLVLDELTL